MNAEQAISQMVPPSQRRNVWQGGVLQIWVTRACDKACFHCTQGSNLGGKPGMISPDQYEAALDSIQGYFGVVGMFGGNPALHPQFETLCEILRSKFPFHQRGLWCNHPKGKGATMRKTFNPAISNLNVHQDAEAYEEFLRDWPELKAFKKDNLKGLDSDSRHGPPFVAMQDVIASEEERWKLIADCDVNKYWSSMICVFRGELRAYVCELMGAQAMLHQNNPDYPDTGLPVTSGWWRRPIQDFSEQIKHHCHACGIPLKGYGALANTGPVEQYSQTHETVVRLKIPGRARECVTSLDQLQPGHLPKATDYIQNGSLQ